MNPDCEIDTQFRVETEGFAEFLPEIATSSAESFDAAFYHRLAQLERLSARTVQHRVLCQQHFSDVTSSVFEAGLVAGRARAKPLGYAGDYLLIDRMYTQTCATDDMGRHWDAFYHRQAAAIAVRNRKEVFKELLAHMYAERNGRLSVLNLASGPCRDVAEALTMLPPDTPHLTIDCVDVDPNAIDYASRILSGVDAGARVRLDRANVMRLRPGRKYDLVWSAGLFDYLSDRSAVALLKRMWDWTRSGGQLVVGNFHPSNPTLPYMEWCVQWNLIHRTEADYRVLCAQAEIPTGAVAFDAEPLKVCLFCSAKRD